MTGTNGRFSWRTERTARVRMAERSSSSVMASPATYFSSSASSVSVAFSTRISRKCLASSSRSAGMSSTMYSAPSVSSL